MHERTCVICGAPLKPRQQKYCGRPCAIKGNTIARANDPERMARHMVRKAEWQKRNRDKCKTYRDALKQERTCEWCGRTFESRTPDATRCKRCANAREGAQHYARWLHCSACGRLHLFKRNALHKGCTAACRWLLRFNGKATHIPWKTCPDCGGQWIDRIGGGHHCTTCRPRRTGTAKHSKWISKHRRIAIYERDGWTCQLCGQPVDPALGWDDLRSASLDHIIPRVDGGTHEDSNLRLAHRICSTIRSDGRRECCYPAA